MRMQKGLSLVEMIVVLSILATLLSIGYVRLTEIGRRAPLSASVETLIGDLHAQQTKAMSGVEGESYGVAFQTHAYTLFTGNAYSGSDPTNAVTPLESTITLSPSGSWIVFAKGSGEVTGQMTVTLTQTFTGEQKTISINRYGAVTSVQ